MDTVISPAADNETHERILERALPFPVVAFVVGGDYQSAMGVRARAMAAKLSRDYTIEIVYRSHRKVISILTVLGFLLRVRPVVTYVFDIFYTGVIASGFYKLIFRNLLIVETGDAIVELARSSGSRGKVGVWLTRLLEKAAFYFADRIIVRGTFHKQFLAERGIEADVIQDAVDTDAFIPQDASDLRRQYGLENTMTIGLVGTSIWSEKLQMCYGWELVETLRLLKDRPVKGIMIGDGSGIDHLKARCREYGVEEKIIFLVRVAYDDLPAYLGLIDICLSTQTNDVVGRVRTTGKLPLYLAAGKYILASKVGEAELVLKPEMLVRYDGVKDLDYPRKLSERIENILERPDILKHGAAGIMVAKEKFDYRVLAARMGSLIESTRNSHNTHRN